MVASRRLRLAFMSSLASTFWLWSIAAMAATVHVARYEDQGPGQRRLIAPLETEEDQGRLAEGLIDESSYPQTIVEHKPVSEARIVELRSLDAEALNAELHRRGVGPVEVSLEFEAQDEVITLVDSGPAKNRIDLVFMGDGYTRDEREKFFDDMRRLVREMFEGDTYRSYLPLFNVHAVFRPSNQSGIGKNDRAKDTAYGLYRAGNTLRAIYVGKPAAARASCRAAPGCDYPVIIGNDDYYGGLGGEFAIATRSETTGTVVLRHELGHNFGRVGEEYDGGGYFGANHSTNVRALKWDHWLTQKPARAEPAVARFLAWPWYNLSRGPYVAPFRSDGRYAKAAIRFSASGFDTAGSLSLTLNGEELPWRSPGTKDRTFYDIIFGQGFASGRHELRFAELDADGDNWVSSLTIHEYGEDYNDDPDFIGAFPVFNQNGGVAGYRSNHETCLMRNMMSPRFCNVCQENNWLQFLAKVRLIDAVNVETIDGMAHVSLATQRLGQLRTPADADSRLIITWRKNGAEISALADQTAWTMPLADARGKWEVEVRFETPEVRKDTRQLLSDKQSLSI